MKIGIIGCGIVGSSMKQVFEEKTELFINDPKMSNSKTYEEIFENCEVIFVCVPTPMKYSNQSFDSTIIDGVIYKLEEINKSSVNKPVICIKSTLTPDRVKEYKENTKLNLTMSPEFLTEANYLNDAINMKALIVGGLPEHTKIIIDLFENYSVCRKGYPIGETDIIGACFIKYMENSFLALKVTFMNQIFDAYKLSGSEDSWENIVKCFHLDKRLGCSHGQVPGPDGDRGWGGKCFPKDVNSFIHYLTSLGVDCDILEKAWEINLRIRKNQDWFKIEGAVSKE